MEKKFTKKEMHLLNSVITMEMQSKEPQITLGIAKTLREKIYENTMKTIAELNTNDLRQLVYNLMRDGAEVQGQEVEEFCLNGYGLEW